jgi:hypothetical protein
VRAARRQEFVATYDLPEGLEQDLIEKYPDLGSAEIALRGLRQWLRLHVAAPQLLAMPSQAVDLLWHDFILHTEAYQLFCRKAYGRPLHHSPERSMDSNNARLLNGEAMARTFAMACVDEGIRMPTTLALPILFSVDTTIALPDGQHWVLDCGKNHCVAEPPQHCVRHQVRPFIPKSLPRQRNPRTERWASPKGQDFASGVGVSPLVSGGGDSGGHSCGGHGGGH